MLCNDEKNIFGRGNRGAVGVGGHGPHFNLQTKQGPNKFQ